MQYVRLLFWLKWKLLLRGYRRSKSEWLGGVMLIFVLAPIAFFLAFWFYHNFEVTHGIERDNWLRSALMGIYAFWIFLPILGYSLNDSYDITKLFVYPLSMRSIFAGTIAGTLLDRPTILLLPTFLAVMLGFAQNGLSAVFIVVSLCLFLLHTLALSQALLMAGAGIFQSRKFRDAAVVLLPLIWIVYYMRFMVARQARWDQWDRFVHSPSWEAINYLPHGWTARAISAASQGQYGVALLFLAGMATITYGTFLLAGWTLQRVYAGETTSGPSSMPSAVPAATAVTPSSSSPVAAKSAGHLRSIVPGWLPRGVRAVADKEFRYLARDPYYKMVLVNLLWPIVLPIILSRAAGPEGIGGMGSASSWALWIGPTTMTFMQMQLTNNIFGTEGGAITLLFLFPADRRQIVLGKNLFHFTLLTGFNLVMAVVLFAMSHNIEMTALILYWTELSLLVNLALGNLFSLYFPMRVVMRGWRVHTRTSGQGCFFMILYMVVLITAMILFVPVAAVIVLPLTSAFGISPAWLAVSLPAGALYVLAIYMFSLYLTNLLLPRREDPIIAKVSQEQQ